MITLTGLTSKQVVFCDIMWEISSLDGVENFIKSLPEDDQRMCRSLVELMQLEICDSVDSTDQADLVIKRIQNTK